LGNQLLLDIYESAAQMPALLAIKKEQKNIPAAKVLVWLVLSLVYALDCELVSLQG